MDELARIAKKFEVALGSKPKIEIPSGRDQLAVAFGELGYTRGAEIGTAEGIYAEVLCKAIPNLWLMCVDPWEPYYGYNGMQKANLQDCYETASARLAVYQAKLMKAFSMEAVRHLVSESLDFVYIDANHELPWIMDDLHAWAEKVRVGGIIAGHDYHAMNDQCHVQVAVDCYTKAYHIAPLFILTEDRYPSWFWVKE